MKRQRGRNRSKPTSNANNTNPNRSWDSQGPENTKVRGNAQTVYERYLQLARDAASSGDRVLAENYQQHAEHYYRVLRALQPQRTWSDIAARELSNQGFDIDFEDESGAQAAAIVAAQEAIERQAREAADRAEQRDRDRADRAEREAAYNNGEEREHRERREPREPRQPREMREPREVREPREIREPREPREPRAEGELDENGGRRETRRERWERRREERNRRFDNNGVDADGQPVQDPQPAFEGDVAAETPAPVEAVSDEGAERPARRVRSRREVPAEDASSALPGFLTRSAMPAIEASESSEEAPAPRRRAPRRKPEAADNEG